MSKAKPDSSVSIREMTEGDVAAVSQLAVRIWHRHYVPDIVTAEQIEYMRPLMLSEESFQKILGDGSQKIWLLFCGAALAGYITLTPQEKEVWFLDKLYVDTNLQRTGLGETLLQHAVDSLRPEKLVLRVNRKNYQAVNFYFKQGFTITRLDTKDIGGGFVMEDFIMEKTR